MYMNETRSFPMPQSAFPHILLDGQGGHSVGQYLLLVLLVFLISGCICKKHVSIRNVPANQDLPAAYLVDYAEQMRYLAMREKDVAERKKRLARLDAIDNKIEEARRLMEEYRKEFGFRKYGSSEKGQRGPQ